jgi:hypothetical protein
MREGDSDLEGDSCKHSALPRQGATPRKAGCKGKDGKSLSMTPLSIDRGKSIHSCPCIAAVRILKLKIAHLKSESPHGVKSFVGLDTHADNTVLGSGCMLIHDVGHMIDVLGFVTTLSSIELSIVMGVVAYDHPITGKV